MFKRHTKASARACPSSGSKIEIDDKKSLIRLSERTRHADFAGISARPRESARGWSVSLGPHHVVSTADYSIFIKTSRTTWSAAPPDNGALAIRTAGEIVVAVGVIVSPSTWPLRDIARVPGKKFSPSSCYRHVGSRSASEMLNVPSSRRGNMSDRVFRIYLRQRKTSVP